MNDFSTYSSEEELKENHIQHINWVLKLILAIVEQEF